MAIKGYYSVDGGAVVRARVAVNFDVTDVWAKSLLNARAIEPIRFGQSGLYYSVADLRKKSGQRYYTYLIDILDSKGVLFYELYF